ncbi:hypothetical protein T02_15109 [Trichinella nativa]|uniref:Uncharacterized protein n=1 Tax=Trichinella nativa TaxID=6335 RepID=A0A0V1L3P5_9BILA|nr:hypothetical protein T02_15109 [Trichinella nativa]
MTELGPEIEVRGGKDGEEDFSVKCKTGKPWKESAFVATTAKLYLLIRFTFLLS